MGRNPNVTTWAVIGACVLGLLLAGCSTDSSSVIPGTSTTSPAASSRSSADPAVHRLAAVFGVGVDVVPRELLDGSTKQPTGTALVRVLQEEGVQLVRLIWGNQDQVQLDDGGWKVIFSRLAAAHINALLTLHMQAPGQSEGPGVSDATITNLRALEQDEEGVLSQIKRQWGGSYPSNLVALDVFNEPVLDDSTVQSLRLLARTITSYSGGIPVTIGGWRSSTAKTKATFNDPSLAGLASTIGDFVSVHLYPDNMAGGGLTSTSAATIEPFAQSFLSTAITAIASAGHSGTPVLITETGGENGQAPGGGFNRALSGSPAHQQATIEAVLDAAEQFVPQGVRGALIWWITPAPKQTCQGGALICFDGLYRSPALPLIATHQFS